MINFEFLDNGTELRIIPELRQIFRSRETGEKMIRGYLTCRKVCAKSGDSMIGLS